MNMIKSQSGMIVALVTTALFAFLFGDAVGDPLIGALVGVLAFASVMPLVALVSTPRRLHPD